MGNPYVVSKEFNWRYVGDAYLYSLLALVLVLILSYPIHSLHDFLLFTLINGLLFPFAKYLYDFVVGFSLQEKIIQRGDYQRRSVFIYDKIHYSGIILTFLLSFLLAPFGMVFLLLRLVFRKYCKKSKH